MEIAGARTRLLPTSDQGRVFEQLDEEVARLHLDHLGAQLTTLTDKQANYLGLPVEGPYKPEHYRY